MAGANVVPGPRSVSAQWRNPALWAYLLLTGVALAMLVYALMRSGNAAVWTAGLVWLLWLVPAYWLVGLADRHAPAPVSVKTAAVVWGAVCLMYSGPAVAGIDRLLPLDQRWTPAIAGPVAEESVKLLGVVLIALVVPAVFRRPLGALMGGMLAGLGFTFAENWFMSNAFVAQGEESLVTAVLTRGLFFGPWGHLLFTGIASLAIWYVLTHQASTWWWRWLPAAGLVLAAMGLHAFHNASGEIGGFLLKIAVWAVYLVLLIMLIRWARRTGENAVNLT